ncbi:MAG: uracil-DNA glycosylase [Chitinispirillaceae bacterium]
MSVRSLLISYLQQQRQLGHEEMFFSSGFEVNRLFSRSVSVPASTNRVNTAEAGELKVPPPQSKKEQNPFQKLSKVKPVEALNIRKSAQVKPGYSKRDLLKNLYFDVLKCTECPLEKTRGKVVFGSGSAEGRLMIVGYEPGAEDEKTGLPFKGETEELFLKMLKAVKLDRNKDVFVTHVLKCRTPGGRKAEQNEIDVCRLIIDRQLDIIKPKAVLVFGADAANALMGNSESIEQLRGSTHMYKGIPLVATYSVEQLYKNESCKPGAWGDLKGLMAILNRNDSNGV